MNCPVVFHIVIFLLEAKEISKILVR